MPVIRLSVERENVIDHIVRGNARACELLARRLAVLADECDRFYPWPALAESMRRDVKALREVACRAQG